MPRENRKRGKKHKKTADPDSYYETTQYHEPIQVNEVKEEEQEEVKPSHPSWVVQDQQTDEPEGDPDFPFGLVDVDVKAYFRTVDVQLKEWQFETLDDPMQVDEGQDPNEAARHLFFTAALEEMNEKEMQLATDPECSIILERMIHSMDDFARRVLVDRFVGSYEKLIRHRFASHVCQTLLDLSSQTISREFKSGSKALKSKDGELRTMSELIPDVCEELTEPFTSLVKDQYASHVLRALLLVLVPSIRQENTHTSDIRSKKSAGWKSRQGPLKSVFTQDKGKDKAVSETLPVPEQFSGYAKAFIVALKTQWPENEIRSMASNTRASPLLKVMLEAEAELEMTDERGSLFDIVTQGLLTFLAKNSDEEPEYSHYLATLLRDQTSSHLMEALLARVPPPALSLMWSTYFKGQLARLATHPVANFVVAKGIERLDTQQVGQLMTELKDDWSRIIGSSRAGVLKALVNRCAAQGCKQEALNKAVLSAFDILEETDHHLVVQCALRLAPVSVVRTLDLAAKPKPLEGRNNGRDRHHDYEGSGDAGSAPKVQGALLLHALLGLPQPHNQLYIENILNMSLEELTTIAHHPISSRVLDSFLELETVPIQSKRKLVLSLIGHFHILVDDRIGSRVGDRCWAFADTYLKEKIARSLFAHEQTLAASYYGKFFARKLSLHLLRFKPEEWKTLQKRRKEEASTQTTPASKIGPPSQQALASTKEDAVSAERDSAEVPKKAKKRKDRVEDEIDVLFKASGKKPKREPASTTSAPAPTVPAVKAEATSTAVPAKTEAPAADLDVVLQAIRGAPKALGSKTKKRR